MRFRADHRVNGILYRDADSFYMHLSSGTEVSLEDILQRVVGEEVCVFLQNIPDGCHWGNSGLCPMGHPESQNTILTFQHQGTLHCKEGAWKVDTRVIPFSLYEGHACQFEVTPSVESLQKRVSRLRSILQRVRDL